MPSKKRFDELQYWPCGVVHHDATGTKASATIMTQSAVLSTLLKPFDEFLFSLYCHIDGWLKPFARWHHDHGDYATCCKPGCKIWATECDTCFCHSYLSPLFAAGRTMNMILPVQAMFGKV